MERFRGRWLTWIERRVGGEGWGKRVYNFGDENVVNGGGMCEADACW